MAISRDGRFIVSAGDDRMMKIWNFKSGELLSIFSSYQHSTNQLLLTADQKYLISTTSNGRIKLWRFDTCSERRLGQQHIPVSPVSAIAALPKRKWVASGEDALIFIWLLESG